MKISELSTDRALDVICEITPFVDEIATDEELISTLKEKIKLPEGATRADMLKIGADKINKIVPIVLKKRRSAVYGILAALNETSAEKISKQSMISTAKQIKEAVGDKELIDFFKSCVGAEGSE